MIQNVKVEDAVNQATDSKPGLHCLIIYDDLTTLREFYSYYTRRQIEEKQEMIQINPFYETTDVVRETLATGYKPMDVEKYERKEKRLVIVDSFNKYTGQKDKSLGKAEASSEEIKQISESKEEELNKKVTIEIKDNSNWWSNNEQMVKYAKKMGNTTLSILADMGPFYFMHKIMELFEYECSLPKHFDPSIKGFCIYNQRDFNRLSEDQKQRLSKHHGKVMKIEPH